MPEEPYLISNKIKRLDKSTMPKAVSIVKVAHSVNLRLIAHGNIQTRIVADASTLQPLPAPSCRQYLVEST